MKANFLVIHHSEAKDHGTLDWAGIRDWHVNGNGWQAIGYHFGLEKIGERYEILIGRMPTETGAHCMGLNRKSWGLCLVGNFDLAPPPEEQWNMAVKFAASLTILGGFPIDNIVGHREGDKTSIKTCPGRNFDMVKFRKAVFDYRAALA